MSGIPVGGGDLVRVLVYDDVAKAWVPMSSAATSTALTDAQLRADDVKVSLDGETVSLTEDNKAQIVYEDGDILYVCKAPIGTAPGSAAWQIKKVDSSSGLIVTWADGNANYDNLATSLVVVQALSYS